MKTLIQITAFLLMFSAVAKADVNNAACPYMDGARITKETSKENYYKKLLQGETTYKPAIVKNEAVRSFSKVD